MGEIKETEILENDNIRKLHRAVPIDEECPKCGWMRTIRYRYQLADGSLWDGNDKPVDRHCKRCGARMSNLTIRRMLGAMKEK